MAFGRMVLAWLIVSAWLIGWHWAEHRRAPDGAFAPRAFGEIAGEALLATLFGALWFGSLGAGAWWLPFLLVGTLREWPIRSLRAAARVLRVVVAGGLLAAAFPT